MTKRYLTQSLVLSIAAFFAAQAAQAATCTAGFNNQGALRALPKWADDNFVSGDPDATPPKAPTPYQEPCTGGKTLWAGEDWVDPKYFHYHLGYENSCMSPALQNECADGLIYNTCTDSCTDASLQWRKIGTHWYDHRLRFSLQPPPAKWCISRLTGNDVPANDANATCSEYSGAKMAPLSVEVSGSTARMYLWWKEKMGVGTPAGVRYTIVDRFTAVDVPVGNRTFSGYTRKYHLVRFTGIASSIVLDNFAVDY